MASIRSHFTYSNVVSTLCLFALLGGGAYAANKITSKDLAKNSVKSKAIKNGQVKGKDMAVGAVGSTQLADGGIAAPDVGAGAIGTAALADGGVEAADLAADEATHYVGAAGEPAYNNGGEGDCLWGDTSAIATGLEDLGYYKDSHGRVHISGVAGATEIAGAGDEECGSTSPEANDMDEDNVVFMLPSAYRPARTHFIPGNNTSVAGIGSFVVVGQSGLQVGTVTLLPGSVYATSTGGAQQIFGGSWRLGGAAKAVRGSAPPHISREDFEALLGG